MNMTSVLHRRHGHPAPGLLSSPPSVVPPATTPDPRAPWPTGARVVVAILAVAALMLGIAAVLAGGDDDSTVTEDLRAQIATLSSERDEALRSISTLDDEIARLDAELFDALVENGDLSERVAELEARLAELDAERTELLRTVDSLTAARDAALAEAQTTAAALETAQRRLADALAERDALAARFPVRFDASLDGAALVGKHRVKLSPLYCVGLPSCGTTPTLGDATISRSAGNLRLAIPGFVDGGLYDADGALHLVAASTTAVPACDGTTRTASIVMTVFPGGLTVAEDGSQTVTGLHAVVTVEAPAAGGCPAGLAFYRATLTAVR